MKPVIILNLKAYKEAFNAGLSEILSAVDKAARDFPKIEFVVVPNILLLREAIMKKTNFSVFSQHADPVNFGAYTGHIPVYALKLIGADGTIINHSERKVSERELVGVVETARKIGLRIVACGGELAEVSWIASLQPDYVAFEPPELIGTGRSVSKTKPEDLKQSVKAILDRSSGKSMPICGAGISTGEDVKLAFELGARGILVASAFVKAKDKLDKLREFAVAAEESV